MKSPEDRVLDFLNSLPKGDWVKKNAIHFKDNKAHIYQWMVFVMRKKDNMERYIEVERKLQEVNNLITFFRGHDRPEAEEYMELFSFLKHFRRYIIGVFDAETQSLMPYDVKLKI